MPDPAIKRPSEARNAVFDFTNFKEIRDGETIATVELIWYVPNDGILTFGAPTVIDWVNQGVTYTSSAVKVLVGAGTDEFLYDVYCRVSMSVSTHKLVCKGKLYVGDGI